METIPNYPLLPVPQEAMMTVRQSYDLDVKKINDNLDAIEEWCKKQDHLIEALPYLRRDIMERFLILGRGSIEQTKNIIDKVLTVKVMLPEFIQNDPEIILKELESFLDNVLIASLSKPNPSDNTRIFLYRLMNENFDDINFLTMAKYASFVIELRMNYDYLLSDRLIFDFKNVMANIITKLNPSILKKLEIMFMDAYKIKLKGIHIINAQPFINTVVTIFKQVIKEKIANRIYVHTCYEDLYREIPKEILPKEYGGDQESCIDLAARLKNYLKTKEAKLLLKNSTKLVANESKRNSMRFNEEYFGMPGCFKQLIVD